MSSIINLKYREKSFKIKIDRLIFISIIILLLSSVNLNALIIGGKAGGYHNGTIDELRIYSRVLTADEIKMHYLSEIQRYNLTQYRFYINITEQEYGTYYYYGWANDTVGNPGQSETRVITLGPVNTAPTITANATKPDNVYTNTDWKLNLTITDPDDGDTLTGYVQFYINGSSSGAEQFTSPVTNNTNTLIGTLSSSSFSKGANLTAEFWAGDNIANTTKENTTQVTVLNSIPSKVVLSYPENNDTLFINRTPRFNWTQATDSDNEQLTYQIQVSLFSNMSSPLTNETGISTTYYIQPSELGFTTYYWKARANDSEVYGSWSDTWNFTLVPFVSIILTQDSVNFGTMAQFDFNDTTNNQPNPFELENDGNTEADINVSSTSLWSSESAQLNTSYYQFRADNSTENNSFNWLNSQTSWSDMSNTYKSIIDTLNHSDSNDLAEIEIRVEVIPDEPPGSKSATITFYAEES